jgi:glucosamine 6-phosphate synthetase-like amidotransferase/phosphosugar isomerase protein
MVTMLDCIKRTPEKIREIVANADVNTDAMIRKLGEDVKKLKKIIVIGSGSSNNGPVTAQLFMEKASGLEVQVYLPNDFRKKTVYPEDAVYVFVLSQVLQLWLRKKQPWPLKRVCILFP